MSPRALFHSSSVMCHTLHVWPHVIHGRYPGEPGSEGEIHTETEIRDPAAMVQPSRRNPLIVSYNLLCPMFLKVVTMGKREPIGSKALATILISQPLVSITNTF